MAAAEYVRSYQKLVEAAASGQSKRIEPYLQQLARYDARYIEQLESHQVLSEDIAVRLLQSGMMKGKTADTIKKGIAPFLVQEKKSAHGRMINCDEAKSCGLKVSLIDLRSELWGLVWELYVRADWVVENRCKGLIESKNSTTTK
jgi:hypothetical protein